MSVRAILAPVFVQVALTFALLFWMGRARFAALRPGEVQLKDIALGERAWPARSRRSANAYHNQFETPVLFYALVAFAMITRQADLIFVVLSWIFVVLRARPCRHPRDVERRRPALQAFVGRTLVLVAMWVIFRRKILAALGRMTGWAIVHPGLVPTSGGRSRAGSWRRLPCAAAA